MKRGENQTIIAFLFGQTETDVSQTSMIVYIVLVQFHLHVCPVLSDWANMKVAIFLCFVTPLPLLVQTTSFKQDFLTAGTVRTDPLMYSKTGDCLSDHVHRFFGAASPRTMRPGLEVREKRILQYFLFLYLVLELWVNFDQEPCLWAYLYLYSYH